MVLAIESQETFPTPEMSDFLMFNDCGQTVKGFPYRRDATLEMKSSKCRRHLSYWIELTHECQNMEYYDDISKIRIHISKLLKCRKS